MSISVWLNFLIYVFIYLKSLPILLIWTNHNGSFYQINFLNNQYIQISKTIKNFKHWIGLHTSNISGSWITSDIHERLYKSFPICNAIHHFHRTRTSSNLGLTAFDSVIFFSQLTLLVMIMHGFLLRVLCSFI